MAVTLNASASAGFVTTADTSTILQLQTNGTAALTVDTSAYVGIGTSSPNTRLQVQMPSDGSNGVNFRYIGGTNNPGLFFSVNESTTVSQINASGSTSGILAFATSNTERMRIDSSGNVGIGTSSPGSKLQVSGIVSSIGSGTSIFAAGETGTYTLTGITSPNYGIAYGTLTGRPNPALTVSGYDAVAFGTNQAERMRIDSSGNLLVGTTSANLGISTLSGKGVGINGDYSATYGEIINSTSATGTQYLIGFGRNGSLCGNITSTATNSTTYATSSDYRLKNTIAPMTGALAKVAQLKPVTYKWNVDGSNGEGFIAHELQEVVPDAVVGEKDAVDEDGNIKPQGIDTSFLVATLTAAIQELKALVDTQASTITQLQADVAALKGQ